MKLNSYFIPVIASVILFSSVPLIYAWTGPTATPPAGNVAAPINISSTAQNKAGVLGLGGLAVFGKTLLTEISGYTLPTATKPNMLLGVNGAIGASEYCDQYGRNCVSTLGGNSSGTTTSGSGTSTTTGAGWRDVSLSDTSDYNISCDYKFYVAGQILTADWGIPGASGGSAFQGTYVVNKAIGWQEYNIMLVVPSDHKDRLWVYWLHGPGLDSGFPITRLQERC